MCACYYADHECSSRRVQLSRRDTVNVGRSPGCWIMDQRRTPAQLNAVWSDVTVISADWHRPLRADSPLYGLVNQIHSPTWERTQLHEHTRLFLIKRKPSHVMTKPVWLAVSTPLYFQLPSFYCRFLLSRLEPCNESCRSSGLAQIPPPHTREMPGATQTPEEPS